jgi:hypothetical protein
VLEIITQALDYFTKFDQVENQIRRISLDKRVKLCSYMWVIYFEMLRTQSGLVSTWFADPAVDEPVNKVFGIGIVMQTIA